MSFLLPPLKISKDKIFLTCKLKHRKIDVRKSFKNFAFLKKYHFSNFFSNSKVFLFLFPCLVSRARVTSFCYLKHLFMIFQQSLTCFEKLFCQISVIHLNFGFFERGLIFQMSAITFVWLMIRLRFTNPIWKLLFRQSPLFTWRRSWISIANEFLIENGRLCRVWVLLFWAACLRIPWAWSC